jgi:hypothetical protein
VYGTNSLRDIVLEVCPCHKADAQEKCLVSPEFLGGRLYSELRILE